MTALFCNCETPFLHPPNASDSLNDAQRHTFALKTNECHSPPSALCIQATQNPPKSLLCAYDVPVWPRVSKIKALSAVRPWKPRYWIHPPAWWCRWAGDIICNKWKIDVSANVLWIEEIRENFRIWFVASFRLSLAPCASFIRERATQTKFVEILSAFLPSIFNVFEKDSDGKPKPSRRRLLVRRSKS